MWNERRGALTGLRRGAEALLLVCRLGLARFVHVEFAGVDGCPSLRDCCCPSPPRSAQGTPSLHTHKQLQHGQGHAIIAQYNAVAAGLQHLSPAREHEGLDMFA